MFKAIKRRTVTPLVIALGRRMERKRLPDPPIIIGGCGRSGTTLLLSVLDAHPQVCSIPEQSYAFMRWERPEGGGKAVPYRLDRLYRKLLTQRIPESATRWCEKTPMHVRFFGELLDWYGPHVRLIHLIRDGRDVVTSRHPFKPSEYWVPYHRWVNDVSIGLSFKDHPQVLTLTYEEYVADFEAVMGRVYAFLELGGAEELEDWQERTTVRKSRHWARPVHAVTGAAVGRWRNPEHSERVAEFLAFPGVAELMSECGYDLDA